MVCIPFIPLSTLLKLKLNQVFKLYTCSSSMDLTHVIYSKKEEAQENQKENKKQHSII